jgi:hypothetical protein
MTLRVVDSDSLARSRPCAEPGCAADATGDKNGGFRGLGNFCPAHKLERVLELNRARERRNALQAEQADSHGVYQTRALALVRLATALDAALAAEAHAVQQSDLARDRWLRGLSLIARASGPSRNK